MRIIKKIWNMATTAMVIVVMIMAFLLVGVRLIGLTPYAVLSGSMEPTYHVGSLIYVKDISPEEIDVGTPITFVVNEDLLLATHRVIAVEKITEREEEVLDADGNPVLDESGKAMTQMVTLEEPVYYYQTKGDANEDMDGSAVHHKNVVGTPIFSIPYLGYLSSFLQTRKGMILGISVAMVVVIFTFMPDILNLVDDEPVGKKKKKKRKHPKGARPPQGAPRPRPQGAQAAQGAPRPRPQGAQSAQGAPRPRPQGAQAAPAALTPRPQQAAPAALTPRPQQSVPVQEEPPRRRRAAAAQPIPAPAPAPAPMQGDETAVPARRRRRPAAVDMDTM